MDVKNMSFKEKLDLIYNCIFDEDNNKDTVWENNPCVQKDLAPNEYLRLFYDVFGKKEGFLRALYKIFLPKEDVINNDILIIAKEQQGVCAYGLEIKNGRVLYLDVSNNVVEPLHMQIDDFIFYLIAIQCSGYCSCSGEINDCIDILQKYDDKRVSNITGSGAVYCFPEGVVMVLNGTNAIVSSKDDYAMTVFEENTAFDVDYF